MSMGLIVLIIWLLNITEHHCVNTLTQTVCLRIVYAEIKNSGLHRSVSRCNRSVDQPGLEPGTSRL